MKIRFAAAAAALTAVVSIAGISAANAVTASPTVSTPSDSGKVPSLTPTLSSPPTSGTAGGGGVTTISPPTNPTGTPTSPTSTPPSSKPTGPRLSPVAPTAPTIVPAGLPVLIEVTGAGHAQSISYSLGFGTQLVSDRALPWSIAAAAVGAVSVTATPAAGDSVGCRITQGGAVLAFQAPRGGSVTCQGFTTS